MPEFDAYLMVDWSANSRPVTGGDSIWYCVIIRTGDSLSVLAMENPATRRRAVADINDILRGLVRREQMRWSASISRMATQRALLRRSD
jgi:precorrin-8X/cobalt-precorrin-8 methylmutase